MGTAEFLNIAIEAVTDYVGEPHNYGVYVVWNCKTLQNNKAYFLPTGRTAYILSARTTEIKKNYI